jgi:alkylation response protein AidB-like acyl-CoA dehydrogenase
MHFNEIFFSDVRIPADHLLGELNNGWNMATAMLMYERVAIGTGSTSGIKRDLAERLIAEATRRGIGDQPVLRQKLMRLYTMETVQSLVSMRTRAELRAGKTPGPGGSIGKLATAGIHALARDVSMEIVGASGIAWSEPADAVWQRNAVSSLQVGIAGGTNEIQKNIIGDRVLGLPRDVSVDKGMPFRELKTGTQVD